MKKLVRRMKGGLGRAWAKWVGDAEQAAWLKGCAGRLANSGTGKAFNRWLEALEEMATMRKFLKRSLNAGMARGFSAWGAMAEQAARDRRQMTKFGTRMLRAKEVACFNKWCAPHRPAVPRPRTMPRLRARRRRA